MRGTRRCSGTGGLRVYYPGQLLSLPWNLPFLGRIPAHQLLEEGQTLPTMGGLRVLHTPGHTPGSIALYLEERGVLFSGDMLLSDGRVFFRPFPFPGTNFRAYRSSVKRLARLEFDVACVRPRQTAGGRSGGQGSGDAGELQPGGSLVEAGAQAHTDALTLQPPVRLAGHLGGLLGQKALDRPDELHGIPQEGFPVLTREGLGAVIRLVPLDERAVQRRVQGTG